MSTAVNGFRKAGIWPVDKNVFEESDFLPCSTTDIQPAPTEDTETEEQMTEDPKTNDSVSPCDGNKANVSRYKTPAKSEAEEQVAASSNFPVVSPGNILAIPKVDKRSKRKPSSRRGKTVV
ncbi:tigger transposable element-derived protein 6-like protein, partial [Lasius niger]